MYGFERRRGEDAEGFVSFRYWICWVRLSGSNARNWEHRPEMVVADGWS